MIDSRLTSGSFIAVNQGMKITQSMHAHTQVYTHIQTLSIRLTTDF